MKEYLQSGFLHVIPYGYDHLLFMTTLYMASRSLREAMFNCTLFTLAHSLTLLVAGTGWITYNEHLIEPVIALSVFVMAINNIKSLLPVHSRYAIIFVFGLFHGLGFANALRIFGQQGSGFVLNLLYFNLGVELAQLSVLIVCFLMLGVWLSRNSNYRDRIYGPFNFSIACIALFWTISRVMDALQ